MTSSTRIANMPSSSVTIQLPEWLRDRLDVVSAETYTKQDSQMDLALQIAAENVKHGTGGPFGAAVFNTQNGMLVSVGVNLVTSSGLSITHAEVVAITMAQAALQHYDLADVAVPPLRLATSAEPCSMCIGAIHWSGLKSIIASARDEDVREIGFDEGNKPHDWVAQFAQSGIKYVPDVLRDQGRAVLQAYARGGGRIYNAGTSE